MKLKRLMYLISVLAIFALSLSACGGSDDKDSTSKKADSGSGSTARGSSTNTKKAFQNDVVDVCESVDQDVFTEIQSSTTNYQADPQAFQDAIEAGEDELDRVLSELDDIDPPVQYEDDWETFIDNFSAVRDAYPQLAEAFADLTSITVKAQDSTDPAVQAQALEDIGEIQTNLEALIEDLTQRQEEISEIADRLNLGDCNLDS